MTMRAAAAVAAILALAGCGGAKPQRHTVELRDFGFVPASLTVQPGDSVTFVNHDAVPHTATADDGSWDTGELLANGTKTVAVKGAGGYKCVYHPVMKGAIALAK